MQYRFCSNCGVELHQGKPFEPQHCRHCDTWQYHNSKPCSGALVIWDGRVLLARRGIEPYKGYWDIPGGFLQAGEHPEAGAIRELEEETGLHIRLDGLLGMYMDRYGADGAWIINMYYLARVLGGTWQAKDDVAALEWFTPDALPTEFAFEHQARVMDDLKRSLNSMSADAS